MLLLMIIAASQLISHSDKYATQQLEQQIALTINVDRQVVLTLHAHLYETQNCQHVELLCRTHDWGPIHETICWSTRRKLQF